MSSVRASRYLIPTLKDDPADAEAVSHRLLVRGGFVRQVGSGLYTYLPLGWRVMQRIREIIRQEMDTIGLEWSMPVLQPGRAVAAQRPLRHRGAVQARGLLRQAVRAGDDARGVHHLPRLPRDPLLPRPADQIWYHIQTKERDEPRPKSGILRTREFIMKDSYSFDRDEDGLDESYQRHIEVYKRIYDRCGLEYWMVESDVGMMGGRGAHEFMAPSPAGEDVVALCSTLRLRRQRGAGPRRARARPSSRSGWTRPGRSRRPA